MLVMLFISRCFFLLLLLSFVLAFNSFGSFSTRPEISMISLPSSSQNQHIRFVSWRSNSCATYFLCVSFHSFRQSPFRRYILLLTVNQNTYCILLERTLLKRKFMCEFDLRFFSFHSCLFSFRNVILLLGHVKILFIQNFKIGWNA